MERKKFTTAVLLACLLAVGLSLPSGDPIHFTHHSHEQLSAGLRGLAARYPTLTRIYSIGTSVEGRELLVLEISDNPGTHEPGEPEVKYVANMHGNEVTGRETLLHLAQYVLEGYGTDPSLTRLVDSTRIHLLPTMNPDGYARAKEGDYSGVQGRQNANGYDLNRNFPDRFGRTASSRQKETQVVMDWFEQYPFVLSANLHNGALVANYPYDNSKNRHAVYTATPDDDIFRQLALTYSNAHATMHLGKPCPGDYERFTHGITNGAAWYVVDGGMQDYNYLHSNCFEITIEQGCYKFPPATDLEGIWNDNREALLAYLWETHKGVKGFVKNSSGQPLAGAQIAVAGRDHVIYSAADGDYWRLLSPGTYTIMATADGYQTSSDEVTVTNGNATSLNFELLREGEVAMPTTTDTPAVPTSQASTQSETESTQTESTQTESEPTQQTIGTESTTAPPTTQETKSTDPTTESSQPSSASSSPGSLASEESSNMPSEATDPSSSPSSSPSSTPSHNATVIAGVLMLFVIVVLGVVILALSILVARHIRKGRPVRQGFKPIPVEDEETGSFEENKPQGFSTSRQQWKLGDGVSDTEEELITENPSENAQDS